MKNLLKGVSIEDLKEMTSRLKIDYDILSDQQLEFSKSLSLPNSGANFFPDLLPV